MPDALTEVPDEQDRAALTTVRDLTGFSIWQVRYLRALQDGDSLDSCLAAGNCSESSLARAKHRNPRFARACADAAKGLDVLGLEGGKALAQSRMTAWVERLDQLAEHAEHDRDSVAAINSGAAIAGAIGQGASQVNVQVNVSTQANTGALARWQARSHERHQQAPRATP